MAGCWAYCPTDPFAWIPWASHCCKAVGNAGCNAGALPLLAQHAGVLQQSLEERLAQKPEAMRQHHKRPDQSTHVGPGPASLCVRA